MLRKVLLALATLNLATSSIRAQQTTLSPTVAPASTQPLTAIPYSPSLDLTSLDQTVAPCEDFYKFSCGGWQRLNPIPADRSNWNVYSKLHSENEQFLWGILLEDAKATRRTPIQQKVGDYFAACMDTAAIDAAGLRPATPELARIDGIRTRQELLAALTMLQHVTPGSYFFDADIEPNAADSSTEIVQVNAGGLALPDRDYYMKTDAHSLQLKAAYVLFVERLLTLWQGRHSRESTGTIPRSFTT
jgi:putative endopeptidase